MTVLVKAAFLSLFATATAGAWEHSPLVEIGTGSPKKLSVVVMPDALAHLTATQRAGGETWVTMHVQVGTSTGIAVDALPYSSDNLSIEVEAFTGIVANNLGVYPVYGGGLRIQFRVIAGAKNALLVSPGVDFYIAPPQEGMFFHSDLLVFVAANADISWIHEFGSHFGTELGLQVGAIDGAYTSPLATHVSRISPEVSVFAGVRF